MVWSSPLHTRKKGWEFSANIQRGKLIFALSISLYNHICGTPNDRDQLLMVKFCVRNTQFACGSSSWVFIFQFLDTRYRINLANLDLSNGNQLHSYTHKIWSFFILCFPLSHLPLFLATLMTIYVQYHIDSLKTFLNHGIAVYSSKRMIF